MLKNFILTTFRTFARNKTYFGLGVVGLTLAIACIISLYTVVNFQSSYDTHHTTGEDIYRIIGDYKFEDRQGSTPTVPHLLANGIREELTNVAAISNIYLLSDQVNVPEASDKLKKFRQDRITFAQDDIFQILEFKWIAGEAKAFEPNDVYLSKSVATKFFGVTDGFQLLLDREITLANKHTLLIKGIYEDFPKKTDFPFAMMTAYENQEGVNTYYTNKIWGRLNGGTQCLMRKASDSDAQLVEKNINAAFDKYNKVEGYSLKLQPLSEIHTAPVGNYSGITFIKEYEIISFGIAIVLGIIGAINFINLSTARAIKRAKEVGIRKVMGSMRKELIFQFLLESALIVLFALLVGFLLADQILIAFNTLVTFEISLQDVTLSDWVSFSATVLVTMTLLSGFYPALVLSGFSPLNAIKTKVSNVDRQSRIPLRKLLVGVQFSFSILLIVCALVIFSQMKFMKGFDMGFKTDGVVSLVFPEPDVEKQRRLKLLLTAEPEFEATSVHLGSPIARTNNTNKFFNPQESKEELVQLTVKGIDENYLDLFQLKLLAGRNVSGNSPGDVAILTRKTSQQLKLGSPSEALGKVIQTESGSSFKVHGVIEDFNSQSLNRDQVPVMLVYRPDEFYEMAITLSPSGRENMKASMQKLEAVWDEVYPNLLIQYDFLDDQIKNQYQFVEIISKSTTFYVFIALIISILGLYGLTDYLANAKKKEIGIRKVVGAEVSQVLKLFLKEVLLIILISFVIASSASYFFMSKWLNGFEYRIELGWEIIAIALLSITAITAATMGYRSYKAATINPVTVLKDE